MCFVFNPTSVADRTSTFKPAEVLYGLLKIFFLPSVRPCPFACCAACPCTVPGATVGTRRPFAVAGAAGGGEEEASHRRKGEATCFR